MRGFFRGNSARTFLFFTLLLSISSASFAGPQRRYRGPDRESSEPVRREVDDEFANTDTNNYGVGSTGDALTWDLSGTDCGNAFMDH